MIIISHRGNGFNHQENSFPAFSEAIKNGFSIEIDIHLSKDKVPFIIHDADIKSVLSGKGKVNGLFSKEIEKYHYRGNPQLRLVRLEEVLELCKQFNSSQSKIFIHIKNINEPHIIPTCVSLVKRYKLEEKCFLFAVDGMDVPLIKHVKKLNTNIKTGLYLSENSKNFTKRKFKIADFIWVDEVNTEWFSEDMSQLAHKLKKKIHAVSPEIIPESKFANNYKQRWRDIKKMGFDGICTDYPYELQQYNTKSKDNFPQNLTKKFI